MSTEDDDTRESLLPEFAPENPRQTMPMHPSPRMTVPMPPPPRLPGGVAPPTSHSSVPSSMPPPPPKPGHGMRTPHGVLTPPPTPRALLEGRPSYASPPSPAPRESSMPPPSNTSVPPPLTNPRDNFRRIERLRNEVRGIKAIQGKHERDVLTLKGALEHLDKRFTAQQSMRSDDNVDGRLALLGARIARLETQTGVVPSDVMLGKLATLEERLSQLEARLAEAPAAAARATEVSEAGAPAITDIRGIGPKYAKALAKLGVRTPADVARWTPEDVEKAASALGIPATRIQKAGWIEQAQELEKKA